MRDWRVLRELAGWGAVPCFGLDGVADDGCCRGFRVLYVFCVTVFARHPYSSARNSVERLVSCGPFDHGAKDAKGRTFLPLSDLSSEPTSVRRHSDKGVALNAAYAPFRCFRGDLLCSPVASSPTINDSSRELDRPEKHALLLLILTLMKTHK